MRLIRTTAVTMVDGLPLGLSQGNVGKCAASWSTGWLLFLCFWVFVFIILKNENKRRERKRILRRWAY